MLVSTIWYTGGSTTGSGPALTLTMPRQRDAALGGFGWSRTGRPGLPGPWPPAHILGQPLRPLCRFKYKSHNSGDMSTECEDPGVDHGSVPPGCVALGKGFTLPPCLQHEANPTWGPRGMRHAGAVGGGQDAGEQMSSSRDP